VVARVVGAGPGGNVGAARRRQYRVSNPIAVAVGGAERYVAGAYADPVQGHHGLDHATFGATQVGHVLARAEVVQGITAATRFFRTEGNELHRQCRRPLAHHLG
jgi:hypothetical protein